ncbi:MAG TPA: hypothetical protein VES73_13610 [Lamprocystis sp. (in: g-proteobacteria)]|nr:hypothetical protein [Lamprocystis sp. (in: g-proteobacteria)]
MAFLIAGISAFATWLTLGLSSMDVTLRAVVSALTFATVGGTLLHYIFSCIKRHCRHDDGPPRPLPDPCLPVRQQTVAHRPG